MLDKLLLNEWMHSKRWKYFTWFEFSIKHNTVPSSLQNSLTLSHSPSTSPETKQQKETIRDHKSNRDSKALHAEPLSTFQCWGWDPFPKFMERYINVWQNHGWLLIRVFTQFKESNCFFSMTFFSLCLKDMKNNHPSSEEKARRLPLLSQATSAPNIIKRLSISSLLYCQWC